MTRGPPLLTPLRPPGMGEVGLAPWEEWGRQPASIWAVKHRVSNEGKGGGPGAPFRQALRMCAAHGAHIHQSGSPRGHQLTLGKKVRVTKCLYSRKGMPWLRFSSLVRSVMSVCSSAKPGDTKAGVSVSQTHPPAGKAEAVVPTRYLYGFPLGSEIPSPPSAAGSSASSAQRGGSWCRRQTRLRAVERVRPGEPLRELAWAPAVRRAWRGRCGKAARPPLPSGKGFGETRKVRLSVPFS